uniref:beta-lactamase n=1 Tax=Shewanella sp. (strain MR-7) TaxID=60481 RepID=Q0HVG8_SHESR
MYKALAPLVFVTCYFAANADTITIEKVSDQLLLLKGVDYGTNIGVLSTSEGLVFIDPMPGDEHLDTLSRTIQSLYGKPVKFILNTHEHTDHTGGNQYFIQQGASLAPTQSLASAQSFMAEIVTIQVSSHSAADRIYFHPQSNSLFVGDIVDNSWHPTFYAGGIRGFNAAINHNLRLGDEDSLILPGHGKPSNKASLRSFQQNTNDWVHLIETQLDAGKSVDDIIQQPQVAPLIARFNQEGKSPVLPPKALRRFIERTISVIEKERLSTPANSD